MDISRYSLSVCIFTWLLQCYPKNRAILVQKLGEELSKSVSGYLKTKKKFLMAIKPEGGGGVGLNGPAIKRRTFFLRLPLKRPYNMCVFLSKAKVLLCRTCISLPDKIDKK